MGPSLRDALIESWAGKSYYERLESMVDQGASPAVKPSRRLAFPSLLSASPLTRAAAAAAALDDECAIAASPGAAIDFAQVAAAAPYPAPPADDRGAKQAAETGRLMAAVASLEAQLDAAAAEAATQLRARRDAEAAAARLECELQAAREDATRSRVQLVAAEAATAALRAAVCQAARSASAILTAATDEVQRKVLAAVSDNTAA